MLSPHFQRTAELYRAQARATNTIKFLSFCSANKQDSKERPEKRQFLSTKFHLILSVTAQVDRKTHHLFQYQDQKIKPSNKPSRTQDQNMQSHTRLMCGTCQTFVLQILRVVQGSTGIPHQPWTGQWEKQISVGKPLVLRNKFHTAHLKQAGKASKGKMESRKRTGTMS